MLKAWFYSQLHEYNVESYHSFDDRAVTSQVTVISSLTNCTSTADEPGLTALSEKSMTVMHLGAPRKRNNLYTNSW